MRRLLVGLLVVLGACSRSDYRHGVTYELPSEQQDAEEAGRDTAQRAVAEVKAATLEVRVSKLEKEVDMLKARASEADEIKAAIASQRRPGVTPPLAENSLAGDGATSAGNHAQ